MSWLFIKFVGVEFGIIKNIGLFIGKEKDLNLG